MAVIPKLERVVVLDWFDVFVFDDAPTITCPDCGTVSPSLRDVYEAVCWAESHQRDADNFYGHHQDRQQSQHPMT